MAKDKGGDKSPTPEKGKVNAPEKGKSNTPTTPEPTPVPQPVVYRENAETGTSTSYNPNSGKYESEVKNDQKPWEKIHAENQSKAEGATEVPEGMMKHVITQEDLDANPELSQNGVGVGDVILVDKPVETPVISDPNAQVTVTELPIPDTKDDANSGRVPETVAVPAWQKTVYPQVHNEVKLDSKSALEVGAKSLATRVENHGNRLPLLDRWAIEKLGKTVPAINEIRWENNPENATEAAAWCASTSPEDGLVRIPTTGYYSVGIDPRPEAPSLLVSPELAAKLKDLMSIKSFAEEIKKDQ